MQDLIEEKVAGKENYQSSTGQKKVETVMSCSSVKQVAYSTGQNGRGSLGL